MKVFLLYTIVAIIANASIAKIIYFSIQDGQWLDKLLDWQNRLRKWTEQNKWWVKPLGYCEMCFSHLMAVIGFPVFLLFATQANINPFDTWWLWIIWYVVYVSIATNVSLYFIVKLFNK